MGGEEGDGEGWRGKKREVRRLRRGESGERIEEGLHSEEGRGEGGTEGE